MVHTNNDQLDNALRNLPIITPDATFETNWRMAVRKEERLTMKPTLSSYWNWKHLAPLAALFVLIVGSFWVGTLPTNITTEVTTEVATERAIQPKNAEMQMSADYASPANETSYAGAGVESNTPQKLIHTAYITLRTVQFQADKKTIEDLVAQFDGYIENSSAYNMEKAQSIDWSIRIPSERLQSFLDKLSTVARVASESISTHDVTLQYADNQVRLDTYLSKRTRLNELLTQATTVEDIISIESALADTQYQIDSYETTQRTLDNQVDMSQVQLNLQEDTQSEIANAEDMSLSERMQAGLQTSLRNIGTFLQNMLVFIVMASPVLIPIALVGFIIYFIIARRKRR